MCTGPLPASNPQKKWIGLKGIYIFVVQQGIVSHDLELFEVCLPEQVSILT
jgi:hypothetical protein